MFFGRSSTVKRPVAYLAHISMIYSVADNVLFISWWLKFIFYNDPIQSSVGQIFNMPYQF